MQIGRLPVDEQLEHLRAALSRNHTLAEVLARAPGLGIPDWYLVAGCLYQTVWNVVTGQPPESGSLTYSTWSCGPTRCWRLATSTRPRLVGGAVSGRP
jgi:hypothetical protein